MHAQAGSVQDSTDQGAWGLATLGYLLSAIGYLPSRPGAGRSPFGRGVDHVAHFMEPKARGERTGAPCAANSAGRWERELQLLFLHADSLREGVGHPWS